MSSENKELIKRWFEEVWNKRDASAIKALTTENCTIHGLADSSGNELSTIDAFCDFHKQFTSAFPNINIAVEDVIAEGDRVIARCVVRATHTNDLGEIKASQAAIDFTGVAIVRVENGKIAEAWNNFDFLTMNKQLGIL